MITGVVPLLYAPDHILHAPESEFDQGKIIDYRETPDRIEGIYRYLLARGLGWPVRARIGPTAIAAVIPFQSAPRSR